MSAAESSMKSDSGLPQRAGVSTKESTVDYPKRPGREQGSRDRIYGKMMACSE